MQIHFYTNTIHWGWGKLSGTQPPVSPAPGDLMPSWFPLAPACMYKYTHRYTHMKIKVFKMYTQVFLDSFLLPKTLISPLWF